MKKLCTICARGGSKGVKSKNIRQIAGKPLIAYSIEQARRSALFELIAVSSDSPQILEAARQFGADLTIMRPQELASDTAPKIPAIRHCVTEAERISGNRFDVFVDLDATSPLRIVDDIIGAIKLLEETGASNVITAAPARRSPYFNLIELDAKGVARLSKPPPTEIVRRQDAPACFDMNASIYVWRREALFGEPAIFRSDTKLFVMPEERSIDIDSELDFRIVEMLLSERKE